LVFRKWYLENGIFDECITWRLTDDTSGGYDGVSGYDIVFEVNGKQFIQRFVNSFEECYGFDRPEITFFRGGFPEYCELVKHGGFGKTLYLGAGRRVTPNYGGSYDKILVESETDKQKNTIPFYKTANNKIFFPILPSTKEYDICWVCNFTQLRHKGQDFFIQNVARSKSLKKLRILHIGNKPEVGKGLCKANGVDNIEFIGSVSRPEINKYLNVSKFGLVTSNTQDGCPRILTEIMTSGTPLIVRDQTRFLDYYKDRGVMIFQDNNLNDKIEEAISKYKMLKDQALSNINTKLSMDNICNLNLERWNT
jgi:glycosyltransferase involved in cell wall biosynthesis